MPQPGSVVAHMGVVPRSGCVTQQLISTLIYKQMSCMTGFSVAGAYPAPCKLETDLTHRLALPVFVYV